MSGFEISAKIKIALYTHHSAHNVVSTMCLCVNKLFTGPESVHSQIRTAWKKAKIAKFNGN